MSTFPLTATSGAGRESWRTDGTAGGAAPVRNVGSLTSPDDHASLTFKDVLIV